MTHEYALLSLRAGFLAGAIDSIGNDATAIESMRGVVWELTPQLVEELQTRALASGVPQKIIDQIDRTAEAIIDQIDRTAEAIVESLAPTLNA